MSEEERKFLEIVDLKKGFGSGETRQEVLRGMNFSVAKGEFCVLLGPSGSGKSTLLNIIGGIDSADSGYISINGDKLKDLGEKKLTQYRRKHLGYVFQMYNLIGNLDVGDVVSLDEKYESRQYQFEIAGIYDRCQSIAVFMPIQNYRAVFDLEEEEFSGYMSDSEITDIEEENIATVITERDITKMCDQLDHSMGAYMQYFQILCILLSAVLIYLLTKIIIEKNENAISMTKILGYENGEIARLYLLSTTMILIVVDAVSVGLGAFVMSEAWKMIMFSYTGWFTFMIQPSGYVRWLRSF